MKRVNLFPDFPDHATTGIPLFEAHSPHIPDAFWLSLKEHVRTFGKYANTPSLFVAEQAVMPGGGEPAEQHRIIAQFEFADGYLLFVDILSLQTVKRRFSGYWMQVDSQIQVFFVDKAFSNFEAVNLMSINWWWQRHLPDMHADDLLENIQIEGLSDFRIGPADKIEFRWVSRGLMRLRILPKARLGFRYGFHSTEFVGIATAFAASRLRIRRKFEWGVPNSRTFWSLWWGFYDIFLKYAGYN